MDIFLCSFESYPSLLKSPEFMTLAVLKHAYSAPALKHPADYSATPSATSTKLHCPIKFIFYAPSNFPVLYFYCLHLKVSIYTCCGFFYFHRSYDKGVVSVWRSN